jgi:hypothetical protein
MLPFANAAETLAAEFAEERKTNARFLAAKGR